MKVDWAWPGHVSTNMVPAVYLSMDNPEDFGQEFRVQVRVVVIFFLSSFSETFFLKCPLETIAVFHSVCPTEGRKQGRWFCFMFFPRLAVFGGGGYMRSDEMLGKHFRSGATLASVLTILSTETTAGRKRRGARLKRDSVPSVFPWTRVAESESHCPHRPPPSDRNEPQWLEDSVKAAERELEI